MSSAFLLLVHPCDEEEKGGCEDICEKKGAKASCKCRAGYALEEDGKSCEKGKIIWYLVLSCP